MNWASVLGVVPPPPPAVDPPLPRLVPPPPLPVEPPHATTNRPRYKPRTLRVAFIVILPDPGWVNRAPSPIRVRARMVHSRSSGPSQNESVPGDRCHGTRFYRGKIGDGFGVTGDEHV